MQKAAHSLQAEGMHLSQKGMLARLTILASPAVCMVATCLGSCVWLAWRQVGGIRRIVVPVELGYPDNDYKKQGPKPTTFAVRGGCCTGGRQGRLHAAPCSKTCWQEPSLLPMPCGTQAGRTHAHRSPPPLLYLTPTAKRFAVSCVAALSCRGSARCRLCWATRA